ncbi:2'-5' RNA ligase family protein [Ancylomarina euxinus]|uniref:2'-5' RNA ligase family protein n=1 Tax=Ancylomarina euxinus TaxID=2283627 RepID=A0A425XYY5_9BACT|nr:2'-5' RNA ligase family protein [Ancylomarina euxinus]MCZ4695553.1 2'-5' RNA ligase family protein [Ancylomarina euxinus]MUP15934.1 2'-5' RNA ligase family protein [Ancylomarina euxinus]RRG20375.1 2'-5' RNA ligase family protein [Ancylomarina euxinus]
MSNQKQNLYFIALIPHKELRNQVQALKENMQERFNAKHALKSPAHITLQMPFRIHKNNEPILIEILRKTAVNQDAFEIKLSGFDCFSPRVIFVKVVDHDPISPIHEKLISQLKEKMELGEKVISQNIHPHMTIATRDLSVENFNLAWNEFKNKTFDGSFLCKSLFLLKHSGKQWDIYWEFHFKS